MTRVGEFPSLTLHTRSRKECALFQFVPSIYIEVFQLVLMSRKTEMFGVEVAACVSSLL